MIRALILGLSFAFAGLSADGDSVHQADGCDADCLLETIWDHAEQLEPAKRDRLSPMFLELVAGMDDERRLNQWEQRIGSSYEAIDYGEDYALTKVRRFIDEEGWEAFFARAQTRAFPFNSGRPEMMAAAAEHLADEATAQRIYDLMERFGNADRSAVAYERAAFGHALLEASMRRCDLESFDRILPMTDAPGSLRYAFWRTRMAGHAGPLAQRISQEFDPESTTLLRQAIDGYSDVLSRESCAQAAS